MIKPKTIYKWIQKRYEYYDKKENQYCGEKYTSQVFKDAEKHFKLPFEQINELYNQGALLINKENYEKKKVNSKTKEEMRKFIQDIKINKVYVASASGDGYADALIASGLAGKDNSPLVLVDEENSTATVNALNYLKANLTSSSKVEILGGTGAVSEAIENKINTLNDSEEQVQIFTGYITTEDDFAAGLKEDSAHMIHMKMMALSGLGITFQENGEWIFYYFDGNISTDNTGGEGGTWIFNGTGSQLDAWNIVEEQIKSNNGSNKMSPVPVTVTGILDGSLQTNPGFDADGKKFSVIKVQSIIKN